VLPKVKIIKLKKVEHALIKENNFMESVQHY
jgi:hypothetical protein